MKHSLAVLALLTAACTAKTPAASSSAVLTPERTWVIVAKPAQPAALDIVRMFHQRGFVLTDMQPDDRGVLLRFKGERKTVSERVIGPLDVLVIGAAVAEVLSDTASTNPNARERRHHYASYEPTIETYELGSVYYVRVEPRGETMTSISAVGRPTRSGVEACTADAISAPCAPLEAGDSVHQEIAGYAEAEVIHSVFSELRLEGSVVAPDVRVAANARRCWERRREVEAAAARVSSPRAKAGIMRTAPMCDASTPSLAAK